MRRRILLADDSVTIQKVIELTFMDEDFEVRAVSNGDEALALLPEVKPDFVIADVHMPGANGYEVCRRSKAAPPGARAAAGGHLRAVRRERVALGRRRLLPEEAVRLAGAAATGAGAAGARAARPPRPSRRCRPWTSRRSRAIPAMPAMPSLDTPVSGVRARALLGELRPGARGAGVLGSRFRAVRRSAPPAPEPFDREPSFSPGARPGLPGGGRSRCSRWTTAESGFAVQGDVFGAPAELSFEEPQDRYLPEDDLAAPAPAASPAGFDWATPLPPEPVFAAEPLPAWEPEPEPQTWAPEPRPGPRRPRRPCRSRPRPGPRPSRRCRPGRSRSLKPGAPRPPRSRPRSIPATSRRSIPVTRQPRSRSRPTTPPAPPAAETAATNGGGHLSDQDVDRIARRVVELLGDRTVRDVAWEVIPDMAEVIIRDRLRELEAQVE